MPAPITPNGSSFHESSFRHLVRDLSDILGLSSDIDSADVDLSSLTRLMQSYKSAELEWFQYAYADPSMVFTRNLVDRGNGKSNLLILVWTPGRESVIHDHANSHCIMKVLKGRVTETRYEWPAPSVSARTSPEPSIPRVLNGDRDSSRTNAGQMRITKATTYEQDQVTYMSDDLGLHKISNPDSETYAVTLHLYTPPNAANHGCKVFDEKSGTSVLVTEYQFYSEFGQKTSGDCFDKVEFDPSLS